MQHDPPDTQDRFIASDRRPDLVAAESWDWNALRDEAMRVAGRFVRSRADAEEVVQEALIRAWRNRGRCRTPGQPVPWLREITRNEALRLRGRARAELSIEERREHDGGVASPDDLVAALDLHAALRALSEEDRSLMLLRYGADLTQPQVAFALGMPEGTAKVRLHRLRRRLRGALKD
jgi:RNA polymerase sigma-70 factor, ECF subfamily